MVQIKDVQFEVNIEKKRIRNTYLRVEGNVINVTCPYYVNDYEVYKFIETKKNWIYRVYQYNDNKIKRSLKYNGGDCFYIHGEKYNLVKSIGRKNVKLIENTIFFTYKDESVDSIKALYKYLDNKLLIRAKEYLEKYRYILLDYGYNDMPELKARIMSSKWGVCYTRKNQIVISSYLINYPLEALEYIIIHELVHFIVPNHSKRFYEIIKNNMPNYKEANNLLK